MPSALEVLFSPPEFGALKNRDLRQTTCVVFDILRATSTMVTALANGAESFLPVAEIAEAVALRRQRPDILLAGERDGLRLRAPQTGGVEFDLGNSPREFTTGRVRGKTIAMTTTNGTRALRACAGAQTVFIGSFLNLRATAEAIRARRPSHLLVVCSGTGEEAALEDTLAAGALCELVWPDYADGEIADSAEIVRSIHTGMSGDLAGAMAHARNGRRLLAVTELRDDVAFCLQRDTVSLVAAMRPDGVVRRD